MPVVALIDQSTDATWLVLEVSSFQLETTDTFHPRIAVILNITPDHLDRHGSFENYALAKERIFAVQTGEDFLVLNADNARAAEAAQRTKANVYWFSIDSEVEQGAFVEDGFVVYRPAKGAAVERIIPLTGIPLKGEHNVENVACVSLRSAAWRAHRARRFARRLKAFHAVEHRLEYVTTINGVEYYNDSKATNVGCGRRSGSGCVSGGNSPDTGRQGQELGLSRAGAAAAQECEGGVHDRVCRGED